MDEATDMLLEGILEIEDMVGATLNWAGSDYPCVGGALLDSKSFGPGGFKLTSDCPIVIRKAVFPDGIDMPVKGSRISFTSYPDAAARYLRVDERTDFRNAFLVLGCNNANQAA